MIDIEVAIKTLQRMFLALTGQQLPTDKARELIEKTSKEQAS